MDISNLSPEVIAKAKACTTKEELLDLAKQEGIELTEEQLASVSGVWSDEPIPLPKCDIYITPPMAL